jgi:hypothetical protein
MPRTPAKKPKPKTSPKKAKPVAAPESKSSDAERPAEKTTGYAAGDRITHPQFGDGTVTAIDADKLTIKFADGRVKQIVDYYVKRREQ